MPERRFELWMFLWVLGIAMGLVGLPALLGFLAGSWLEQNGANGAHALPWRLVFVSVGVGLGGLVAWRVIGRRPSSR